MTLENHIGAQGANSCFAEYMKSGLVLSVRCDRYENEEGKRNLGGTDCEPQT